MTRPNIVYINSHDTGRYVQPYGFAVQTPNIQRLAEEGVLFRQAFCANPTCSPSRASLLTGMWPHNNGMIGLAHRGARLNDYSRHLAQFMRRNGYRTVLSGGHHEVDNHEREVLGYERFLDDVVKTTKRLQRYFDGVITVILDEHPLRGATPELIRPADTPSSPALMDVSHYAADLGISNQ